MRSRRRADRQWRRCVPPREIENSGRVQAVPRPRAFSPLASGVPARRRRLECWAVQSCRRRRVSVNAKTRSGSLGAIACSYQDRSVHSRRAHGNLVGQARSRQSEAEGFGIAVVGAGVYAAPSSARAYPRAPARPSIPRLRCRRATGARPRWIGPIFRAPASRIRRVPAGGGSSLAFGAKSSRTSNAYSCGARLSCGNGVRPPPSCSEYCPRSAASVPSLNSSSHSDCRLWTERICQHLVQDRAGTCRRGVQLELEDCDLHP